jgi:Ser/Thr protein kinase RdoA (MazF antagonist)
MDGQTDLLSGLLDFYETLYTFVVHYLQMCMEEYGCCPKFKRGDNSTYTFTKELNYLPF